MSKSESKILREIKRGVYNSSVDDVQVLKKLESDDRLYHRSQNGEIQTNR